MCHCLYRSNNFSLEKGGCGKQSRIGQHFQPSESSSGIAIRFFYRDRLVLCCFLSQRVVFILVWARERIKSEKSSAKRFYAD